MGASTTRAYFRSGFHKLTSLVREVHAPGRGPGAFASRCAAGTERIENQHISVPREELSSVPQRVNPATLRCEAPSKQALSTP